MTDPTARRKTMAEAPDWSSPNESQAARWCCTYGADGDVVPGAPNDPDSEVCSGHPVVAVVAERGVGRCASHAPKELATAADEARDKFEEEQAKAP